MDAVTIIAVIGAGLALGGLLKLLGSHDRTFTDIPDAAGRAVTEHFSPDMGAIAAFIGEKRVAQQNKLLEQITGQINQVALMGEAQVKALTAQYNLLNLPSSLTLQGQESLAAFRARISQYQNTEDVNRAASSLGVTPLVWEQIAVMHAQGQVDLNERINDLTFTVAQARELKTVDADFTDRINKIKLFMIHEKYFMPQNILKGLNERLSNLYQEGQTLADATIPAGQKRKEAARIKRHIEALEGAIREQAERISGGLD